MADPVGEETKSSSIMFVNLNGNCPRRINLNDAAGLPETPERFSQRTIFRKSMDSKLALPQALPLPPGA